MKVLGIMSGTSIDGVDYALCDVSANSIKLLHLWSRDFPLSMRRRLHAAAAGISAAHEVAQLHHDLGRLFAQQAVSLGARPQLIGLHGQTIFHRAHHSAPATLQLGEAAYLAAELNVPVVSNFRAADIALGGQGAPLATVFHRMAFARRGEHVCVNNLGGISNVTSLDWRKGKEPAIQAFDTGPANVLIDLAARELTNGKQSCDRGGRLAAMGRVCEPLLHRWLKHRYFAVRPPKSTGRELFGETFWNSERRHLRAARLSGKDVLATLTEFTARSIVLNYRKHLPVVPKAVVLCGGGAKNPELIRRIQAAVRSIAADAQILTSTELGWPVEAVEPAAFALLAFRRVQGQPGNIPETTGASHAALCGQVTEM